MYSEGRATSAALLTVCLYEAVALLSRGRVPTVSALLRARPRRLRAAAVAGVCGWLAVHLLHPRWR